MTRLTNSSNFHRASRKGQSTEISVDPELQTKCARHMCPCGMDESNGSLIARGALL